jgi:hypothetical protein
MNGWYDMEWTTLLYYSIRLALRSIRTLPEFQNLLEACTYITNAQRINFILKRIKSSIRARFGMSEI